eukprot:CAMPEP_0204566404 /NCGR_PEP_ID=MMETSP0661-20131031/36030_1 /ASSEMBLY_ACC=CAM_ASM_000606 /TAXON_ID=109239 /ORGANISM="Alexandrium margalefi, Strain AMGDE01CS-322" /LENGTH=292 /DNA_ID=CAMNT_0051574247 /DNA_START=6 /DNA_END=884 /DNA_ORIENTATION=-
MKGMVDNTPPQVMGLRHLKTNWKKAEVMGQRYDTIERDNRHLLNHMNSIGARRDYGVSRSHSLPALKDPAGGGQRQREIDRINQENTLILKRLQNMQAEYRTRDWEEQYKRSQDYVRLKCEYPPPLLPKARTPSRTGLIRLPAAGNLLARTQAGQGAAEDDPEQTADGEELLPGPDAEWDEEDEGELDDDELGSAASGSQDEGQEASDDGDGTSPSGQGSAAESAMGSAASARSGYASEQRGNADASEPPGTEDARSGEEGRPPSAGTSGEARSGRAEGASEAAGGGELPPG